MSFLSRTDLRDFTEKSEKTLAIAKQLRQAGAGAHIGVLKNAKFREIVGVMEARQGGGEGLRLADRHKLISAIMQQVHRRVQLGYDAGRRELDEQGAQIGRESGQILRHAAGLIAGQQVIERRALRCQLRQLLRA